MIIQRSDRRRADRLGFTLMEVLVVVAILVVLAGVATISIFRYLDDARKDRVVSDLRTLTDNCKSYKLRYEEFPASLEQLVSPPSGKPFLETMESLTDPWGQPYQYDPNGSRNAGLRPDIWTITPEGQEIGNWMSTKESR